ncbi:MAG: isochorismatase family protein [Pseudomonadota bacterium]
MQIDSPFFQQRGFGKRLGFGQRPAIIVVDLIVGFTDESMPLGANLDAQVGACKQLIDASREHAIPVFFFTASYDEDLLDAGVWRHKMGGITSLRHGSEAVKVDPRLPFKKGDSLITKKYASCFFGTDLSSRLVALGIDSLFITGCTTSGCVRATAVDAVQNGFKPLVVREAVGDRSQAAHDQSLLDLDAKYADVLSLDEVLSHLAQKSKSSVSV